MERYTCNAICPEGCILHEGFELDADQRCTGGHWEERLSAAPHIIRIRTCQVEAEFPSGDTERIYVPPEWEQEE